MNGINGQKSVATPVAEAGSQPPAPVTTQTVTSPAATSGKARRGPRRLNRKQRWLLQVASTVAILVAWEIYGRSVNPVIFTYPTAIARAFVDMLADGTLAQAALESLVVLGIGSAVGAIAGIGIGLLAGRSDTVAALIEVPVNALYATPSVALIPVIVVWFGFGATAKSIVVGLFVIFPVLINTMRGVREVDPDLLEVARCYCSSEPKLWRDLLIPSALPYIITGLRLAIGRGLVGVIVAEFFTAISGLGNLIVTNANSFETARMFVPIVVIAVYGVLATALLEWVESRLARWHR
ncbi:MAG TPA: ABC transporter permease [Nocardioidaceae bacterium]|nr:ABC transporter permease [Nocardioidaceae bacterium]